MKVFLLWLLFLAIESCRSAEKPTDPPKTVRFFRSLLATFLGKTYTSKGLESARKTGRVQSVVTIPFPCKTEGTRSNPRPDSVHRLRPGDIDIIASLGDSLSAGNGLLASNLLHVAVENRGLSWVIGGARTWREFFTLPNILKEFNPNLIGYAMEDASSDMKQARFSVSDPGAMSRDMPNAAKLLVKRMKNHPQVNFEKDWKLVNFLIGGNDFCVDVCFLTESDMMRSAEFHRKDLIETFDYLRDNMPRTLVNFMLTTRTKVGTSLVGRPIMCQLTNKFECPCLFGEVHRHRYQQMQIIEKSWIKVEEEVGNDPRYRIKDDFALVVQPFIPRSRIRKLKNGKSDFTFVSTDCFHFSQKGSAWAANALWNNMLEPVGNKSLKWGPFLENFRCPSDEFPFIFTWANSNISNRVLT